MLTRKLTLHHTLLVLHYTGNLLTLNFHLENYGNDASDAEAALGDHAQKKWL